MVGPVSNRITQGGLGSRLTASSWNRRSVLVAGMWMLAAFVAGSAQARSLPAPSSPVILVVKGLIGRTNVGDEAHLDRDLLSDLGATTIRTWTPWTDGEVEFEGLPFRALIEGLQASGSSIHARALNDYGVEIPISDPLNHDMLIAWSADGSALPRRDKGPLWIIYPWSAKPELDNRVTNQRAIWQLYELTFYN